MGATFNYKHATYTCPNDKIISLPQCVGHWAGSGYLSAKSKAEGLKKVVQLSYNPSQRTLTEWTLTESSNHDMGTTGCRLNCIPMDLDRSTRVALLYHGSSHRHKVQQVVNRIADETVAIDLQSADEAMCEVVAGCDLIVVEALGYSTPSQQRALQWIRMSSLAPVVVLTNRTQSDRTIDALTAGADAVISLELAHDAIVAHCQALMRRWRAHPYITPRFS